jgi:hypothetical protein
MLSWLRRRRKTAERIDAEADALIGELGVEAYAEARRREYESSNDALALRWNRIALAVGRKSGKLVGLDTSTRMAMNAVFAPDREHAGSRKPQPFSQGDELKGTLVLKPFRLQFISSAPDRGPSIVTDSRFKLRIGRAQSSPLRRSQCRPERSDCASSTVMAARSSAGGGSIAQGSTNDRATVRGVSRRLFLRQGRRQSAAST